VRQRTIDRSELLVCGDVTICRNSSKAKEKNNHVSGKRIRIYLVRTAGITQYRTLVLTSKFKYRTSTGVEDTMHPRVKRVRTTVPVPGTGRSYVQTARETPKRGRPKQAC
jgi:hypothetical protein